MKLRLILITLLFSVLSVFTISCDSDDGDKTCDPACPAYQECNDGTCENRVGSCDTNEDCAATDLCNANHKCELKEDPACVGKCFDQDGQKKGTCVMVAQVPECTCDAGFLTSPNKLRCLEVKDGCEVADSACGDGINAGSNGECIAENDGTLACLCDNDYLQDSTDPLLCVPTPTCSNSNHAGSCDKSCEECLEGTGADAGNWACKVPTGERPCDGAFNDVCDPSLGWQSNPGCDASMVCEDGEDGGYCTTMGACAVDADCIETYNDNFVCFSQGSSGQNFYGECIKAPDYCFDNGVRVGGGEDGDRCSDACGDADCNVGLKCVSGVCSESCTAGSGTANCLQGAGDSTRECLETALFTDLDDYRCVFSGAVLGDSCLDVACNEGLECLALTDGSSICFQLCDLEHDNCSTVLGSGSKCQDIGIGVCTAPEIQDVGEECGGAAGCIDDGWCLSTGFCYKNCEADAGSAADASKCGTGEECLEVGDGDGGVAGYFCEPLPTNQTQEVGELCDSFVNGCLDGLTCIGLTSGDSYCFQECDLTDDQCGTLLATGSECIDIGIPICSALKTEKPGDACDGLFKDCEAGSLCYGDTCINGCTDDAGCVTLVGTGSECITIQLSNDPTDTGDFCNGAKTVTKFGECDFNNDCETGLVCLTLADADIGYCYEECDAAAADTCGADEACTVYSEDGSAFCMTECMSDTDCSIDKVCSTETFKCETPTVAPICTIDEKRCMNDDVETCNADGSAWVVTTCTDNKVCLDDGSTVECVLPTATACGTNGCDTVDVKSCNGTTASVVCELNTTDNCLELVETACTAPAVCDATFECVVPTATACGTNGCDTVSATSCTDTDTMATCTLDTAANCLKLVEADCVAAAPECFENVTNNIYACYQTQTVDCSNNGDVDCVGNLNGLTVCDTGNTNECIAD